MAKTYYFPPIVIMGPGAIELIVPEIKRINVKKALIVTDKGLIKFGVVQKVLDILDKANIAYAIFSDVKPNPTLNNINDGYQALLDNACDYVISIGGGSPQEAGKGIAILATNPGDIRDYEGFGKTANKSIPIVAINTTAGTASEATMNYVVTDEERQIKMFIADPNCMPTIAVDDPLLMLNIPAAPTAVTGMDALTHAVEGYTAGGATAFTDLFNLEAIKVISANLRTVVADGHNLEARDQMAYGQFVTGMGFSNGGLGLVHGMAHPLGGFYDLTHGFCTAILLPYVMAFNADVLGNRLKDIAVALEIDVSHRELKEINGLAIDAIKKLSKDVGMPSSLSEIGVKEKDFDILADMALADYCTGANPKTPTKEEVIALYKAAF
ncbi:MAG TPA: iron-containing alcohol dehydrogenase [Acetobacterium sp.]